MLKLLLILLLIYVALSSVLLIVFDTAIDNLQEALWFIVVTISSVGYGDIVPVNPISKSLAVLTILIGTVSVAIFTAYLSAMYNQKPEMERKDAFIEYFNKLDETNKALNDKVSDLNDKVSVMEEENKLLKDKLDEMTDKLDAISDKL